ncbi:glycosyltransferase family 4 protein [Streptomyces sp. NBC_00239]|uniref:glycosyltransferase family 4 protein n=1 Tax=Streptomyces sp. NBC_00239 TaxID=2903640 RepID=UPI002E2974AA|nr:glycosyltransferase family 4 protein [Streptomyces sp. NBC_00239]
MTRPLILTGIDLPLEPSCGSTIWCSDVYTRLTGHGYRTVFAHLPGSGTWQHGFTDTAELAAQKAPYGPGFDAYADALTDEVRSLVSERRPDLIHAQHLGFGLALAFARAAGSTPMVSVAHGTDVITATEHVQARAVLNEIVDASVRVIVPNAAMADEVDRLTDGHHTDRLVIVPWGIPLPAAPTAHPRPGKHLRLVHAGRLDANKDTITAIEALARTTGHQLTVIGSGSELETLTRRTAELDLANRVTFEPFLPRQDLFKRFADFHAMLFTTRKLEAYGLVAVEAQAHGLPVLYSNVPGLGVTLGTGGLSFPPGDAGALASLIDNLAASPATRQLLHQAALANARGYDVAHTAAHFAALSRTAMEGAR